MAKTLSQKEIDQILNSVAISAREQSSSNQVMDFSVKPYDFKNPDQLSKTARNTLERIHFTFAKYLSNFLNDYLRMNVQVNYISTAHTSDAEFLQSLPNPTCLYTMKMKNLERDFVFEIQPNLAYFLVDRVLGGPGKLVNTERELTLIEQRLMERFLEELIIPFKSAWSVAEKLEITLGTYYSNPNFVQIADSGESVIFISLEVNYQDNVSLFNIAYPYYLVDQLLEGVGEETLEAEMKISARDRRAIYRNLEKTIVPVSIHLGGASVSFQEIVNLREGDVLFLDKNVSDPLALFVGRRPKFLGKAGIMKNRLAFKVLKPIQ